MFRRYPYRGWLLLSIILWCIAGFLFFKESREMKPAHMARTIAEDIRDKEEGFEQLVQDKPLMKRMFAEQPLKEDIERLSELSYQVYGYDKGGLIFWNTNEVLADCSFVRDDHNTILVNNDRGSFIKKCITLPYLDSVQKLTVLFPIVTRYPIENNYLRPYFEAASYIPITTQVLAKPQQGSYTIKDKNGDVAFYISFPPGDAPEWVPGRAFLWLVIAALLTAILWLQLITVYLTRRKNPLVGFGITVGAIILFRLLTYVLGLPFNLKNLPIFSPQLYATSYFLPSLGDLLLNALCLTWIVVFSIRHMQYRISAMFRLRPEMKIVVSVLLSLGMVYYCYSFINVIRSLVIDSNISFYVSYFYSITTYTLVGLLTITIISGVSFLVIYLINVQLTDLLSSLWLKYVLVAVSGFVLVYINSESAMHAFYYIMLGFLVLFIVLLDIKKLTYVSDLFAPQMIFWGVFICIFCMGTLQYFNYLKERETRKKYAEQVLKQRDYVTEYEFRTIAANIRKDKVIKNFLERPSQDWRRSVNERFDALYLGGQLNKYQSNVLLFDKDQQPLFNNDTVSYQTLSAVTATAEMTTEYTLFYKENAQDGRYYLAAIPIENDSTLQLLGYVFIDLAIKASGGETVYPELLQPGSIRNSQVETSYYFGVYANKKLITQSGEYSFPVYLPQDTFKNVYNFIQWEGSSELHYKPDNIKTVIVIRFYRLWLETITLFSYLFGILMLIVLLVICYRVLLSYLTKPKNASKLVNLTFRRRIHFSMLGIMLLSFSIIGAVTIIYFTLQYRQNNKKKLRMTMQVVERSVIQYLKEVNGLDNIENFTYRSRDAKFKYFITSLATAQKIDINIFNTSGVLNVASQENIYDKILLARIIRPDAYYQLNNRQATLVVQDERIGRLSYLSCYVPLRDGSGNALGYINVPFFSSEKELNFQISNILVALINVYAFIFLLASVFTVFITRWLTRTLSIVINRFERLSLTQNELIDWPYDDEIGMLVNEYNKMVRKVEENAVVLAQNEREMAWREMARQVAHEIKNPLTPMKLNIQYLQQALKSGHANIEELTARVSESLIEQIDNLSYIASEFSNFAKMPEAKPEDLELNDLLDKATELYLNEENVKVSVRKTVEKLYVHSDRSQLLRVFTNLLENAVQAIPGGHMGIVIVAMSKVDGDAIISFKDNGAGITEEVAEKIFQPYFTTKSSGTGLGLAMTRKILEFWNGTIWFETEEGKGTTFHIRLPLVQR